MEAPTRAEAEAGSDAFAVEYEAKYPKAVTSLRRDQAQLLTFYDFPAEHWRHLRTTNIVESPFATVRLRQRVTKGAGSRTKALTMAFKLLAMAKSAGERSTGRNSCHWFALASVSWMAYRRNRRPRLWRRRRTPPNSRGDPQHLTIARMGVS